MEKQVWGIFFKTPPDAPSDVFKSKHRWVLVCGHVWRRSWYYFFATETNGIMYFDHLDTICSDYSEEYRIPDV